MKNKNTYNELRETTDSGSGDGAQITSSDDIAYVRGGGFRDIDLDKEVSSPMTDEDLRDKVIEKRRRMKEAVDKKIDGLKINVLAELKSIIGESRLNFLTFHRTFGRVTDLTPENVLVGGNRQTRDLAKFKGLLNDDVGNLELLLTALEDKEALNKFEIFDQYDFLFGARLQARLGGVILIYEGAMTFQRIEKENLVVSDLTVLEKIQDEIDGIEISKKLVYPKGRTFDRGFMEQVKEVVYDIDSDEVERGEGSSAVQEDS